MKQQYIRHGDVILHPIKALKGAKKIQEGKEYIVAYGEVTGHKHLLTADLVEVFRDETGQIFLNIQGKSVLTHEEHKPLTITPGWYRVGQEREFDYFLNEIKKVQD